MLEKCKTLLDLLSKTLNLESLVLDEDGQVFLLFDNALLVRIALEADRNVFSISSKISELEDVEDEKLKSDLFQELLEGNLFWAGTQGATLGLDEMTNSIVMRIEEPLYALEYERFEKIIEDFVNAVEFWSQHVESIKNGKAPSSLSSRTDVNLGGLASMPMMMSV